MISLYIGHRFMIIVDGIALAILGLHDVVEDAEDWDFERLKEEGFSNVKY